MTDQAERLRQMMERLRGGQPAVATAVMDRSVAEQAAAQQPPPAPTQRRARVLAVTSGKGGVGKTNLSVNLAYALKRSGREVLLLDADLGLANVDVLLGTTPRYHLGHLLVGERSIRELIYTAPEGLQLIAGGSGFTGLADLDAAGLERFIHSMEELQAHADYVLVDTGAGLGQVVQAFALAADDVLLVTTPEPTAMTDAYALCKTMLRRQPAVRLSLIVNQAHDAQEAQEAATRLSTTVLRFLNAPMEYLGHIPHDREVAQAVRRQSPFVLTAPSCPAAQALARIADRITGEPRTAPSLFLDRLVRFMNRWRNKS